jgi:hypothetical protein
MKKTRLIEIAVKMVVAALTAFLTALTTTSCMGFGPYILLLLDPKLVCKFRGYVVYQLVVPQRA